MGLSFQGWGNLTNIFRRASGAAAAQVADAATTALAAPAMPAGGMDNVADTPERTAFFRALRRNQTDELDKILSAHPDAIDWREYGKAADQSPAHIAAHHNNADVLVVLHRHGANMNLREKDGWTPLIFAATTGSHKCVETLLSCGADIHAEDNSGNNALTQAVKRFRSDIVKKDYTTLKALIAAGLDPAKPASSGDSAYSIAKSLKRDDVMLAMMDANTARIESEDLKAGKTPAIRVLKPAHIHKRNKRSI